MPRRSDSDGGLPVRQRVSPTLPSSSTAKAKSSPSTASTKSSPSTSQPSSTSLTTSEGRLRQPKSAADLAVVLADGGPRALQLALRFAPETVEYDIIRRLLELGASIREIADYLDLSPQDTGRLIAEPGLLQAMSGGMEAQKRLIQKEALEEAGHALSDLRQIMETEDISPRLKHDIIKTILGIAGVSTKADGDGTTVNVGIVNGWQTPEGEAFQERLAALRRGPVVDTTAE